MNEPQKMPSDARLRCRANRHPERSEGSPANGARCVLPQEIPRCARDDRRADRPASRGARRRLLVLVAVLGAAALPLAPAAAQPAKPGQGAPPRDIGPADPLRKTLLDALRPAIERDLGLPVQFVVKTLRQQNDWAFAIVVPQARDGSPIDYRRTRYAEAIREGMFDGGTVYALLRKSGQWTVRAFVVGPTDVAYAGWPDEHGAPYALFGMPAP